ncbi:MAG: hypothetical protein HRF42_05820 [Candidatus Brocadia sp.]|jgi:hypothetical protein
MKKHFTEIGWCSFAVILSLTIATKGYSVEPTPTPTATPTPMVTPSAVTANVKIKPRTINLKSKGKLKAFITLPSPYNVNDIITNTIECEGAKAIKGKVDKNRFIATFNRQDLFSDSETHFYRGQKKDEKEIQELTVTGELEDGTRFEGSDTVKIKDKGKSDDNNDDSNDNDDSD